MALSIPVIGELVKGILGGLDGLFTSDEERAEAERKLVEVLQQPAILQVMNNVQEAKHASVFVAGWRPFIGWVCGSVLASHFIILPMAGFIALSFGVELPPHPAFDIGEILGLVTAMLGLSTQRTFEKLRGVHRESL